MPRGIIRTFSFFFAMCAEKAEWTSEERLPTPMNEGEKRKESNRHGESRTEKREQLNVKRKKNRADVRGSLFNKRESLKSKYPCNRSKKKSHTQQKTTNCLPVSCVMRLSKCGAERSHQVSAATGVRQQQRRRRHPLSFPPHASCLYLMIEHHCLSLPFLFLFPLSLVVSPSHRRAACACSRSALSLSLTHTAVSCRLLLPLSSRLPFPDTRVPSSLSSSNRTSHSSCLIAHA